MSETKKKKSFDAVAFQREQRARISAEIEGMTAEEINEYLRNKPIEDPEAAAFRDEFYRKLDEQKARQALAQDDPDEGVSGDDATTQPE